MQSTMPTYYHLDPQTIGSLTQSPNHSHHSFSVYKRADKKIKPIAQPIPLEFKVTRTIPYDPLLTLLPLNLHFSNAQPTHKFAQEHINMLLEEMRKDDFLTPDEMQLFLYVLVKNEAAIAFEDEDRGMLKESYFSPYKIPHVPHGPWQERNIPIPPGLREKVVELLHLKSRLEYMNLVNHHINPNGSVLGILKNRSFILYMIYNL